MAISESADRYEGNPEELRAWQKRMGFTYESAAAALGMSRSGYSSLISKSNPVYIDLRTALACAAIEHGIEPLPGKPDADVGAHK